MLYAKVIKTKITRALWWGYPPCRSTNLTCFKEIASFVFGKFKKLVEQKANDIISKIINTVSGKYNVANCFIHSWVIMKILIILWNGYQKVWILLSHLTCFIVSSDMKHVRIGNCISQKCRPKLIILPIPFGIGVDIGKSFAITWLVGMAWHSTIGSNAMNTVKSKDHSSSKL